VLSPQTAEHSRELKTASKLNFDILHDAVCKTAAAYGLAMHLPDDLSAIYKSRGLDLVAYNGDDTWQLPVPARIVIDRQGLVQKIDADPDYTRRPEPEETLEVLRGLT
jgi:peroxiredoxin